MRQEVPSVQYIGTGRKSKTHNGITLNQYNYQTKKKKYQDGVFRLHRFFLLLCLFAALCDGVSGRGFVSLFTCAGVHMTICTMASHKYLETYISTPTE